MKNLGNFETRKAAHRLLIAVGAAFLAFLTTEASAKTGIIVKGENGTKWCCVGGVKGDTCEKGASSIPTGAGCNFASRAAPGTPIGGVIVKGGKNPGGNP
jgi:hypothetical protein